MALGQGVEKHRAFLYKMGQLTRMHTELPESAEPMWPRKRWSELSTATIAFGHGIAVAPMQAMMGVGALVNGGYLMSPTFLKRSEEEAKKNAVQVIKPETSEAMRCLMRLNAEIGTAKKVNVPGFYRRRQDRHGGEGHPRTLCEEQAVHDLHGGHAGG